MRFVFVSDVHLHNFGDCSTVLWDGVNSRLVDGLAVLESAFSHAREEKIKYVFIGGDLFHDRRKLSLDVLVMAHDLVARYHDLTIIMYPGNHCVYTDNNKINSLSVFASFDHVRVYSRPIRLTVGGCKFGIIPYMGNRLELKRVLKACSHQDVILMHQGVRGVESRSGFVLSGEPLKKEELPDVPTISGHIHEYQKLRGKPFWYAGSPLQLDWGDVGIEKFFLDVETDPFSICRVQTYAPEFVNLTVGQALDEKVVSGNFVRYIANTDRELRTANNATATLKEMGARYISSPILTVSAITSGVGTKSGEALSMRKFLDAYVDHAVKSKSKKVRLKKLGKEILHEAQ